MTRELLTKLPNNVKEYSEKLKREYKGEVFNKKETRERAAGYCAGLRDGGLITDRERQILFIYITC